ncbi:L,D-transpeptidase [Candidatus Gottesmanbacteria bacterium]|nr:L,D-transpeptidase [Candidatus Gottesmanbacteria bacterium]
MLKFLPLVVVFSLFVGLVYFRGQPSELLSKSYIDRIVASDGKFHSEAIKAVWFNKDVPPAPKNLAQRILENPVDVLGSSTVEKWIEVDLSTQHLYAHEGDRVVFDFPISSGLPWFPTVTGEFRIWAKIPFYDLPNVPFVQYFYKGFGLHGAYWHNDFGKPRSHGCVNLSLIDAEKLFFWTEPLLLSGEYTRTNISPAEGTRVVIHGTTPSNLN